MAHGQIVGGFGVPHNPHFPAWAAQGTPQGAEVRRMYDEIAADLAATEPDAIVFVTSDHYNLFFETLPIFMIGVAGSARGASDYPSIPPRELEIDSALARALQADLVGHDFDVGSLQELELDHTIIAPMSFLAPDRAVPIVPVFVSAFLRPLPSARRCLALGRAIREAVQRLDEPTRVAVVASGSFTVEIGGPRLFADSHTGVPAPEWLDRVLELLRAGDVERLVAESTDEQLRQAGNAGGEILDWIVMLGALDADPGPPASLSVQPRFGHAFASWPIAVPSLARS